MRTLIRTCSAAALSTAVAIAAIAAGPDSAAARQRVDLTAFMTGLACVESSGRFRAVNDATGAYGKYQIMPRNWLSWSARYLRNRWAAPTPRNQEFVASMRIGDLRALPRTWRQVAHWWLTGNGQSNENLWSRHSLGYVNRVLSTAHAAARPDSHDLVPDQCFPADVRAAYVRAEPLPRVTVSSRRLFVRVGAGTENRAVTSIKQGTVLAVLGRHRDARRKPWLYVGLLDGSTGWVAAWYTAPLE